MDPRVGSGRVGSRFCQILAGQVGSGQYFIFFNMGVGLGQVGSEFRRQSWVGSGQSFAGSGPVGSGSSKVTR